MTLNPISVSFPLENGLDVKIETGKMARQADGAVTLTCGNCVILATVVASKEPKPGQSFFPLIVDYQEKFASSGKIPGSFFKREGRLNDHEILISRLIDRALRPLFPEGYLCDVQVMVQLISSDKEVMPDALACLAASAALAVSDIPIQEMISEVRVSRIDGEMKVNPLRSEFEKADMDFIIAATADNIIMVEGEAKECTEEDVIKAIEIAHEAIKLQVKMQKELAEKAGKTEKRSFEAPKHDEELKQKVEEFAKQKLHEIIHTPSEKHVRSDAMKALGEELIESLGEDVEDEVIEMAKRYYNDLQYHAIRNMILDDKVRLDGRKTDEIRPLAMEVDILPSPHGSALFTRGETQSLTTITMGTKDDEILLETAAELDYSNFMLHYNFPPFSTGEVKMLRGVSRREVGHGHLAQRSIKQIFPSDFPYTTRIVSDILESNGSSSMATVCAASLAIMDAGIPMKKHISGIAMGLISRPEDGKWVVLSDILGDEDHLGDMDFKITGTRDGICGVQMDIKVDGLSMDVLRKAMAQANAGRLHILNHMYEAISEHREDLKPHTPRIVEITIDKEFIGAIIGPGGKIIQELQRETDTTINIEEVDEKGVVNIFSNNKENLEAALQKIKNIVAVPEVGETYNAIIKSIMPYGAFVEFMPGKQGLLHISEISWARLENMDGVFNEGDSIKVKLTGIDNKTGKYRLSRKVLMPKPEKN